MRPVAEGFGHQELDRVKWRAKAGIVGLAIGAAVVTFIALGPARLLHILEQQIPEEWILAALEPIKPHGLIGLLGVLACGLVLYGVRRAWGRAQAGTASASQAGPLHAPPLRVDRAGVSQGGKPLQRPSFLLERHAGEANSGRDAESLLRVGPSDQSAAGFLMRFRRSLDLDGNETEAVPQTRTARRLLRHAAKGPAAAPAQGDQDAAARKGAGKTERALTSLGTVLSHVVAAGHGGAPRALLVGSARAGADATSEAVSIARALVAGGDQVVLADLACGTISVASTLGLPPSPGLAELCAGLARFEDIVRIDAETPLQVIAAGDPKLTASPDGYERFASVFEALTQAYDGVVLHADREALLKLTSALRFELSAAIAVMDTPGGSEIDLSAFSPLGCPVLVYEQGAAERQSRTLAAPVSLAAASNG